MYMHFIFVNPSTALGQLKGTDIQSSWFGIHETLALYSVTDMELTDPWNAVSGGQWKNISLLSMV